MTRGEAVRAAAAKLIAAGTPAPQLDARVLAQEAFGVDHAALLAGGILSVPEPQLERLRTFVDRRVAGEPVARILGRREFWGLDFALSPETLVPRPDSETLVEAALVATASRSGRLRILDLGTGTGCLLLALLKERPDAVGVGVDRSFGAAETAKRNAEALGLAARADFMVGDWMTALAGQFDLVISNPPYVAAEEIAALDADVRDHDPRLALDGGAQGLDGYEAILGDVLRVLADDGVVVLELGAGQRAAVERIAARHGLASRGARPDLAGVARALVLGRSADAP